MRASNRRPNRLRWCCGALAAAGALVVPSSAQAVGPVPNPPPLSLPTSAPTVPEPLVSLLPGLSGVPSPPGTAGSPSTSTSGATTGSSSPAGLALPTGLPSPTALALPGSTTSPAPQTGATTGGRATPQSQPGASVGGGLAGAGHGCLSAGPANGGGLVVMDQDVLSRLAAVLPQTADFVVPCTTPNGLAVDADLVVATLCLRLDPTSAAPLKATVELAGTDAISRLEAAGLPLGQVVRPCATTTPPTSGRETGGTGAASPPASTPTQVQAAATVDTAQRLPFTGAEVLPTVLLGLSLLLLGAGLLRGRGQHETG